MDIDTALEEFKIDKPSLILCGDARGADETALDWAGSAGLVCAVFHPSWEVQGRKAGPIRNSQMLTLADVVLAFWDGESRGTLDTITKAKVKGIPVHVVDFSERCVCEHARCDHASLHSKDEIIVGPQYCEGDDCECLAFSRKKS